MDWIRKDTTGYSSLLLLINGHSQEVVTVVLLYFTTWVFTGPYPGYSTNRLSLEEQDISVNLTQGLAHPCPLSDVEGTPTLVKPKGVDVSRPYQNRIRNTPTGNTRHTRRILVQGVSSKQRVVTQRLVFTVLRLMVKVTVWVPPTAFPRKLDTFLVGSRDQVLLTPHLPNGQPLRADRLSPISVFSFRVIRGPSSSLLLLAKSVVTDK